VIPLSKRRALQRLISWYDRRRRMTGRSQWRIHIEVEGLTFVFDRYEADGADAIRGAVIDFLDAHPEHLPAIRGKPWTLTTQAVHQEPSL